ncbi:MAG: hypothetical protein D6753_17560 [Planctomycetota bacterium]|nr:MAG: hypothetical protein D6753_17560 [Planctomycetota bacterium]
MMTHPSLDFAHRIAETAQRVFGDSPITDQVLEACDEFRREIEDISAERGLGGVLVALVGAKKQGKSWVGRSLILNDDARKQLPSGELQADSTRHLYWIGPTPPRRLDAAHERYIACPADQMFDLGFPYCILDTPGATDDDPEMAQLATSALSLATVKLLVIARDQLRSAVNVQLARAIEGSICIPIITMVPPDELQDGVPTTDLEEDVRQFREEIRRITPNIDLLDPIYVPDFAVTGDEGAARAALLNQLRQGVQQLDLTPSALTAVRSKRTQAARQRLRERVRHAITGSVESLQEAVQKLDAEIRDLPRNVLLGTMGNPRVLQAGLRLHLRSRFAADTWPIWFPYRSSMTLLIWTAGAWDRLMLAFTGSLPSLFGTLVACATNLRQARQTYAELRDGMRRRIETQIEEQLQPVCREFYRSLLRLRPARESSLPRESEVRVKVIGLEQLHGQSQTIYENVVDRFATRGWWVQLAGLIGTAVFWAFFSGPIALIYMEYIHASLSVWTGRPPLLHEFPHPTPAMLLTSIVLSLIPMMIVCMGILTLTQRRSKLRRAASEIQEQHEALINRLVQDNIIRVDFDNPLLRDAQFLLQIGAE